MLRFTPIRIAALVLSALFALSGCNCGDAPPAPLGSGQKLVFVTQPTDGVAGQLLTAVDVEIQSASGTKISGSTASITLALQGAPAGASLGGTVTVTAVGGRAHFGNLSISRAGSGYSLKATSTGSTTATSASFAISTAAPSQVVFISQPSDVAAGAAITPAVGVDIEDAYGNRITGSTATISIALGANPSGATLSGTTSAAATGGLVAFADLSLDKGGNGYTLVASSGTLTSATSTAFAVTSSGASHLVFVGQPSDATAGAAISPSVQVAIEDGSGNVVSSATGAVTIALGANPGGATLSGTSTVNAVNGIATFPGLSLDKVGAGYTLSASASGVTSATSTTFAISAGAASQLAFQVQPSNAVAGSVISPAVKVSVLDAQGNLVTGFGGTITLAPVEPVTVGGTLTATAASGVATFPDLSITQSGSFHLSASSGALAPVTSSGFTVSAAAPAMLVFVTQPSNAVSQAAISPAVRVAVVDVYGNPTASTAAVTVALDTNPGGGTLGGTTTVNAAGGTATFSNLSVAKQGAGYTLRASSPLLSDAVSNPFDVVAGAPASLAFAVQPSNVASGAAISPAVQVAIVDAAGNVTPSSANVTLSLASNPSGGTLGGTTTVAAVSGVASFSNLTLDKAGSYSLGASSASLASATSGSFTVSAGSAARLAFVVQPSDATAGATISPAIQVAVQDAAGNTVTSSSATVSIAIGTNPGSGTLGGTASVAAVNGVANFNNLSIDKAGSGYTLNASSASLTGATSGTFAISAGAPTQLAFTVQPTGAVAGAAMSPAVRVAIEDAQGNTVTSASSNITLSIGTNPGGSTLSGTATQAAVNGVATFANLSLDKTGAGYTLLANSASLPQVTSSSFTISNGTPSQLAFLTQPSDVASGAAITPSVRVAIEDAAGNVTSSTANVTIALASNPAGGTLGGTLTVAAVNGIATFANLSLDRAGAYTLGASSGVLTPATSSSFNVTAGAASQLVFSTQPSNVQSGAAISPAVRVTVEDAAGNTVTGSTAAVSLAFANNPGGATLGGTTTVNAVSGVATFANVSVDKVGSGYTLGASASGVTGATSSSFNVSAGAAAKVAFIAQPSDTNSGNAISPSVQVAIEDASGNVVTGSSATVSVAIGTNPGGGTLTGTASVAAVNGVATFSSLKIDKAGSGYTLVASSGALATDTSSPFAISAGSASQLVYAQQPSNVASGAAISPAIQVSIEDAAGNVVNSTANVSLALGANPGGSTLGGTVSVNAVAGTATFSNVTLDKAGSGYTLVATSGALNRTSSAFAVSAGAAAKLAFSVQPTDSVAGVSVSPAVQVAIQDAAGNVVTGSSASITVGLAANPGGGTLSGTQTVSAVNGVATFSNLSIDKAASGYRLSASSGSLTGATSNTFAINAAAASQLAFAVQPSNASAGAPITPAVQVAVRDAFGNTVTSSTASISVTLGNAGGATLSGTTTVSAVGGIATFSNLSVNLVGSNYNLSAQSASLTSATSSAFSVSAATATQLVFVTQPSNVASGAAISPAVQVALEDGSGNVVSSTASVTLALGTNPSGGTLGGTVTINAVAGVATFSNLTVDKAGVGYTLAATSGALPQATSTAFNVTAGAASQLAFQVQPSNVTSGAAISPSVKVAVEDVAGNVVTTSSASIALAIASGPSGGALTGTSTVSAVSGVATFSNLKLDKAGSYSLSATSGSLTPATSSTFAVSAGAPASLAFTVQPSNAVAGVVIAPAIQVTLLDAAGNVATGSAANVIVSFVSNPGGATLSGTTTVAASSGVATFSNLSVNKAATYQLRASAGALPAVNSSAFTISAAAATTLAFSAEPIDVTSGQTIPFVQVSALDAFGNLANPSGSVTLALSVPAGATLSGTKTQSFVGGQASYSDLSVDKAGSYSLSATSAGLTGAVSTSFNVTAGAAANLAFVVQPSTVASGSAISPAVQVAIRDAAGNTVTSSSATVSVALANNPSGATLTGTQSVAAVNGVATFSNLALDKVGTGYTLNALSAPLTAATSSSFDVTAGAAQKLAFVVQPSNVTSGAAIGPAVKVAIEDAAGNTVTTSTANVTIAFGANPNGGTLGGTKTVAAVAGVATFSDLTVDKAGIGYSLNATSGSLTAAVSNTFAVTAGTPTQLAFTVQPSSVVSQVAISPSVQVSIEDAAGNVVTSASSTVSLALGANPGSGTLSGTTSTSASSGVATFSNLKIDKAGNGYTLVATSGALTQATSSAFNVTAGAAAQLAFITQPSNVASGAAISPAVRVAVEDASGNTVTSSSATIALALSPNPAGGTLGGTASVAASAGIATFSNLTVDKAASGYGLHATSGTLTAADSSTFTVTAGAAAKLAFVVQPSNVTSNATITPAVQVAVQDANGNLVSSSTASITVAFGTNAGGGTLSGTKTVAASGGVATFSTLSVDKAGTGYTLAATSGALTSATSSTFNVTAGAASQLVFTQQPTNTVAGQSIAAIDVSVEDAAGNLVGSSTASVTLAIATNPSSGTLSGTTTVAASGGVAVFTGLSIDKAGTGYTLQATAASLSSATSSAFNITAGSASQLVFSVQPSNVVAGASIAPSVKVSLLDALGNQTTSTATVSVAIGTNPSSGTLSGTSSVAAVAGTATFANLSIDKSGTGYTLVASSGALPTVTSSAFNVTAGSPTHLAFTTQPSNAQAGAAISPSPAVALLDGFNNQTTSTANVTVAFGANPGSGTLSGTTTVAAVSGVATFPGLSINKAATGYTLAASSASVTGATSNAFNITAASASQLAFLVQPSTVAKSTVMSPAVKVQILDAFGNLTASTATVGLSIGTNPGGATLGGTTSQAASAGVATFSNLTLDKTGTGYTLVAASAPLTSATSTAFNVTNAASGLVYTPPTGSGAKIVLVQNAASTSTTAVLDLVTQVSLTGYAVALNLPVDTTRVQANATLFTAGSALSPGSSPAAAIGALPSTGPLASVVTAGQSQKAAGTGAITTDTTIPAGSVLFTLRLDLKAGAPTGNVFDGTALGSKFRAAFRNKLGNDVATGSEFSIGKLDVQ